MKTFIVDSFTDEAFKGNPAGVCLLRSMGSESLKRTGTEEITKIYLK